MREIITKAIGVLKGTPKGNILKSRDDKDLVVFDSNLELCDGCECSWLNNGKIKAEASDLRNRIEPWLSALFQSEHLSLLCGSGLSNAISYKANAGTGATMGKASFSVFKDKIEAKAKESAKVAGREDGNIEDQIRVANQLLNGLEIFGVKKKSEKLREDINKVLEAFSKSILGTENGIATAKEENRKEALEDLANFLLSFASRTGNRERLNIFTTNYDRLIELGADISGLHIMDRFVGSITPIFRSSRLNLDIHYNPPGIRGEPRYLEGVARMTKLHGSIDWIKNGDEIQRFGLPFGATDIRPYLQAPGLKGCDYMKLMIYPNPDKDRETSEYPYVELFRDFAAAICRPNSTLVTYGYGFGDDHINRVIKDMLTIPSTHLVIISYDDPIGRIMKFYDEVSRDAQMTIMVGPEFGDLSKLIKNYLPKAAIDTTTYKMSELLQHRLGTTTTSTTATV